MYDVISKIGKEKISEMFYRVKDIKVPKDLISEYLYIEKESFIKLKK